jgi:hypothetical protein
MKLYELTEAMKEVSKLLDEGVPFEQLEETLKDLDCDFEEKAKNVLFAIANLKAEAEMIDGEVARLTGKKKTKINQIDGLRNYLLFNMEQSNSKKIDNGLMSASVRKGAPSLLINDEGLIPDEYKVIKTTVSADKKGLLKALKELSEGETIDGAEIVAGKNTLTIK